MLPADQVRGPESPEAASSWETCGHMPGAGLVLLPGPRTRNTEEHLKLLLRLKVLILMGGQGRSHRSRQELARLVDPYAVGAGQKVPCPQATRQSAPSPPHPCPPGGSLTPVSLASRGTEGGHPKRWAGVSDSPRARFPKALLELCSFVVPLPTLTFVIPFRPRHTLILHSPNM